MDKELIKRRFTQNLSQYNALAVVQREIAEQLAVMIPDFNPRLVVEIGAGTGFLTHRLVERFAENCQFIINDITPKSREFLPSGVEFRADDGEFMELPSNVDLVASSSTIQWFDDLQRFLSRILSHLSPSGYVAVSTFGPRNFEQFRNQTLNYYSLEELTSMAEDCGYRVVESVQWIRQMEFNDPVELLRHVKATGVNAVHQTRWSRKDLNCFIENFPRPVVLTFHPIVLILTKIQK